MSRVLIVEDDPAVAEALAEGLRVQGHRCWLEGPQAALSGMDASKIDVVVVDVMLPGGISGIDIADRAAAAGIASVLVTGYDEAMFELEHRRHVWLRKPFHIADLSAAVDAVLQRSRA